MSKNDTPTQPARRHTAGFWDIRVFIGGLMAIYGIVLTAAGIFDDTGKTTSGASIDININLWVGLGLLVFAGLMFAWTRLRPTIVDEVQLEHDKEEQDPERRGAE